MNLFNLIDKAISCATFPLPRPRLHPRDSGYELKSKHEVLREPLYSRITCDGNQIQHFFRLPLGVNEMTRCDTNMYLSGSLPGGVSFLANGLTFFTPERDEKIRKLLFDNSHFSFDIGNRNYVSRPAGGAGPRIIDGGAQYHRLLDPLWIHDRQHFFVTLTFDNDRNAAAAKGAVVMCLIHGLTYRPV